MMQAGPWNFTLQRGADFTRVIEWTDDEGEPVDLEGYTARMMVREHSWEGDLVFDLTNEDGIYFEMHGPGTMTIILTAEQTALAPLEKLVHDLYVTIPGEEGRTVRFLEGRVKVSPAVTHEDEEEA